MYDVIVVGAGPAGSTVAKRCAEYGLNTLVLEKRRLPRDKVCSGMVLEPVANVIIKQEFGDLPEAILSYPKYLSGVIFHVPGIGCKKVNNLTPLAWRRNLDYWMNQLAQAKGAEIWQDAQVTALKQKERCFLVEIEKDEGRSELEARFVIGADGAISVVRRCLFPELKMSYVQAYQEHFLGELDLDKNYFHSFRTTGSVSKRFGVIHKDNFFVLSFGGGIGQAKELVMWTKDFLAKNYGFDIGQEPVAKEGCLEPILYRELMSHIFLPAKGNGLLVGDAGGFIMPVILEGIGLAIWSGILAANSIAKALEFGTEAGEIYLKEVENIISIFKRIQPLVSRIAEETESGGYSLPELLCKACGDILNIYESWNILTGSNNSKKLQ